MTGIDWFIDHTEILSLKQNKTRILPSCSYVSTIVRLRHLGSKETPGEKARLQKDAACCYEQILEATPTKQQMYGYLPPILQTIQDEQVLLCTASEVRTNS